MPCLLFTVRLSDGRYHGFDSEGRPEWPPSPARLFQALVAGAANGAILPEEDRNALVWLERLKAPVIAAPAMRAGHRFSHFMPNNDLDAVDGDPSRIGEIRTATKRFHPRIYDRETPFLYVWSFDNGAEHAERLCSIADQLYQLGRGVDMAWAFAEILDSAEAESRLIAHPGAIYRPAINGGGYELACPIPGSLNSLIERYEKSRGRFKSVMKPAPTQKDPSRTKAAGQTFSQASKPRFRQGFYESPPVRLLYDLREMTEHARFFSWPLAEAVRLVVIVRDEAAERLKRSLQNQAEIIERMFGRRRDATEADKASRIRIVPLPSIGHHHADHGIRRLLVEIPPNCPLAPGDIAWAFSGFSAVDQTTGEILCALVPAEERTMLDYYGFGSDIGDRFRLWRAVTPIAVPVARATGRKNGSGRADIERRAATEVLQALRHARIDARVNAIRVQREPFDGKGARAEAFAQGTRFTKERLWHVEIGFAEPVAGPLILGDGRYMGLGLMAPLRRVEGVHCFAILDGLTDRVAETALAQALRRAVMARVQDAPGRREILPEFFSGHQPSGVPSRSGAHRHLAFAADLARQRVLIVAPHVLERREPTAAERKHLAILDGAVADLKDLRAGIAGRFKLARMEIDLHEDPLFAPAQIWESVTDYQPTRYAKRMTKDEALTFDVRAELNGRRIATPTRVEVKDLHEGPRGGIAGRLRLHFAVSVCGLIMIGRTRHLGGGLFSAVE